VVNVASRPMSWRSRTNPSERERERERERQNDSSEVGDKRGGHGPLSVGITHANWLYEPDLLVDSY
jgi:hypothetical protein